MTRSNAANVAEAAKDTVALINMARLDFASGVVAAHDGVGTVQYNGDTYLGVGEYGGVSSVVEGQEFRPRAVTLTLNGLSGIADDLTPSNYQGRDCDLFVMFLDRNMQPVADPVPLWSGHMDKAAISVTGGLATDHHDGREPYCVLRQAGHLSIHPTPSSKRCSPATRRSSS